jgi:DNA mismatch repair protein MutS
LLVQIAQHMCVPPECGSLLERALLPEPAALVRDGGVIGDAYDADLD